MKSHINYAGYKFGKFVVLKKSDTQRHWECLCHCGTLKIIREDHLTDGTQKSCGCERARLASIRNKTHGMSRSPEYEAWNCMKARCFNIKDSQYKNYGARGITVCDLWVKSFESFYGHMGKRPSNLYSLDRINNDGNYEPGNCRWATNTEQARNTRAVKLDVEKSQQIRNLRAKGVPYKEIRNMFGISDASIAAIISGKSWKADPVAVWRLV